MVQPLRADGARRTAIRCWPSTRWGPGVGETVIISSDGRGTRELLESDTTPVRWSVMGFADR